MHAVRARTPVPKTAWRSFAGRGQVGAVGRVYACPRGQTPASDLIVVPMSRIISHQPGLGTPDEALGDGDVTDGGGGEKRLRGMGLAEIGAQKMPWQSAQGDWRSRNRDASQ